MCLKYCIFPSFSERDKRKLDKFRHSWTDYGRGRVAFTEKLEKELKSAKERGEKKKFFQPLLQNGVGEVERGG